MAVSPVVTGLTQYVDAQRLPLYYRSIFGVKFAKYATVLTDVKFKSNLNQIAHTIVAADGAACGWGGDSEATMSTRELAVNILKYEEGYCVRTLLKYWAGYQVRVALADTIPFEEDFVNSFIMGVVEDVEKKIWLGHSATIGSHSANAQVNGLVALALADSTVIDVDASAAATKFAAVRATVEAIPAAELRDEVRIYCSPEFLQGYMLEMVDLNLYHFAPNESIEEITVPGTKIILTAVSGLSGGYDTTGSTNQNYLMAMGKRNAFFGCDVQDAETNLRVWFDESEDQVRFRLALNAGAQYGFGDRVVLTKIA